MSNESGDIVRALIEYKGSRANDADLRPAALAADIDALNDVIYERVNNGVYRAGFATKQGPYEAAVNDVFDELKRLDGVLAASDYVAGDRVTEADVRLLPTVERFDACYAPLFLRTATSVRQDFPAVAVGRDACNAGSGKHRRRARGGAVLLHVALSAEPERDCAGASGWLLHHRRGSRGENTGTRPPNRGPPASLPSHRLSTIPQS